MTQITKATDRVDVLVVGAGPTGVLLAKLLGQQGVSVLVVDANADVVDIPRAVSFDDEAQRVLQAAGLGDHVRRCMPAVPAVELISPRGRIARIDAAGTVDGFPRLVAVFQPGLERELRRGLAHHPSVELRAGCSYVSHREEAERVVVALRQDGVEQEVAARYLVGSDGARSAVRERQGWSLRGCTYAQDWLIVDVANPPQPLDHVEFLCDPRRPIAHLPAPFGAQRWEFMMLSGETRDEMVRPERVAELLRPWGDVAEMKVLRTAIYRFHARVVDCFGRGRVYLAGDAAHLTPPFAGQGLCAAVRDAMNLSWKLGAVVRGEADPDILASYELERRPHVTRMIRLAVGIGMAMMPTNRLRAWIKDGLLRALPHTPLRALLTDVKIRPTQCFRNGLVLRDRPPRTRARPGTLFAQGLVRDTTGAIVWSDEVLGHGLVLVGMGVDPRAALPDAERDAWERMGGRYVRVANAQQRLGPPDPAVVIAEDLTGRLLEQFGRNGLVAAVRPDRTILGICEHRAAARMIRDVEALLRPSAVRRVAAWESAPEIASPSEKRAHAI